MKSTKAEVERRVHEVFKLRLGGAEFADIREYASAPEQSWNVSDSQIWRYIKAADELCEKYFDAKSSHLLARHLLQRRQLYAHCLGAGDFRTALSVLKDEAELEGLYPAEKVALTDPTGTQEFSGGMSDEQRVDAINRLHARVGSVPGNATSAESSSRNGQVLHQSGTDHERGRPRS